jgi:hypothetical protein
MSADKRQNIGEPTFGEYLKAAFNLRVPVPGLGGVPLNWLYLALVAGASVAVPPVGLVGLAGEIALLTSLSTSGRFQQAVRAQRQARHGDDIEAALTTLVAQLSPAATARYNAFANKCNDVLQIARKLGQAAGSDLDTYSTYLSKLRDVYVKMLVCAEMLAQYSKDWQKTDPLPEIALIQKEIADGKLPDQILASKQATLEVLNKRAQSREEVSKRGRLLTSEIERLEQQLALLRDQALLTQDPSVFSQNMDTAATVLEEHNKWLQDNATFLQTLDNVTA